MLTIHTQQLGSLSKRIDLPRVLINPSKRNSFVQFSLKRSSLPCLKASDASSVLTSDGIASDEKSEGILEKQTDRKSTFPSGFEALLTDICNETSVAEVKLKVGNFEMYVKREIGADPAPSHSPIISPTVAPPIPSEPMNESNSPPAPAPQPEMTVNPSANPFENPMSEKEAKLAFLKSCGLSSFAIVSSPSVGIFRRTMKIDGKWVPDNLKEGDIINEGQIIGFIGQFAGDLPVKSSVTGEVIKFLYVDGETIGYGDPLLAVLPSFHGIEAGF